MAVVGFGAIGLDDGDRLELQALEAFHGAGQAIGAEGIVHMHDGDAVQRDGVQVLDRLLGLGLVAGAHVEHVRVDRLVQQHGAGGRRDERDVVLGQVRQDGLRVRRGAAHEQRHHLVVLDQLSSVFARQLGLELVVERDQLDLLAAHAALGVDVVEVKAHADQRLAHAGRHRAGDGGGLADQDLRLRGAGRGPQQARGRGGETQRSKSSNPGHARIPVRKIGC